MQERYRAIVGVVFCYCDRIFDFIYDLLEAKQ